MSIEGKWRITKMDLWGQEAIDLHHGDESGFKAAPVDLDDKPTRKARPDQNPRLAMTRKPRALTRQMERLIETALMPGRFVAYNTSFSFVRDLEAVEQRLAKDLSMDPPQAVALYETFLAGCYEKAEEIDDSSGSFGQFVGELHCAWIKAGQAAGAGPNDIATQLVGWMEADPYGFCHDLEKDAAKVLNTAGLTALVNQIRERFDAAGTMKVPEESLRGNAVYARHRWSDALRTLYAAQKDVEAYLALAQEMGLTAADCHALATILIARRNTTEALRWVEHGIELAKRAPNRHNIFMQ